LKLNFQFGQGSKEADVTTLLDGAKYQSLAYVWLAKISYISITTITATTALEQH